MANYLYCGLTVASSIALPELPCSDDGQAKLAFRLERAQQQSQDSSWPVYWHHPGGKVVLAYCRKGAFHWLRFPELADFRIAAGTRNVSCFPLPGIPEDTIRHLLLDQVLPRCLAHQGKLMIHASGVWLEKGMVVFIGNSGAGKSTLAAYFHQTGQQAVSDDVIWIKAKKHQLVRAMPGYPGLRLWGDSLQVLFPAEGDFHPMAHYSTKRRMHLNTVTHSSKGFPLLAVILLSPPSPTIQREVCLETLPRRDAFIQIMNETFQLDSSNVKERVRRMQSLATVVTRLPSFRLSVPRDYDLLPAVRQKILDAVM